ncbi:MAG: XdhC family protein [Ignavibacteriae bacterium]|nr:XdhC family protein [Ignavibacteria bacterium]MBI3363457.1 XdhC family protein [Ignavibacteriota bacterium]
MDIYDEILAALQIEDHVMLATIIATTGSTPAAALSKMLVKQGGIVSVGTVGGGCMEGDVLLHAQRLTGTGRAEIFTFHLNEDDIEHGLICGGSLDVLIEPIPRNYVPIFQRAKSIRDTGEDCILATDLRNDGSIAGKYVLAGTDPGEELASRIPHLTIIEDTLSKVLRRHETSRLSLPDGELVLEPIPGCPSLIIFGGGHVSKYVSRIAALTGFRVTIVDDREKFASKERFPEAAATLASDFVESFSSLAITPSTYIVIVTRGHKHDEEILERALGTAATYIGMIGSKRKVLTTFDHLREKGVTEETLQRVHAPVGVEIGAVTAEEIAVSIVAELIAIRRGSHSSIRHKSDDLKKVYLQEKRNS